MGKSIKELEQEKITEWLNSIRIPLQPFVEDEDNKQILRECKHIIDTALIKAASKNNLPF